MAPAILISMGDVFANACSTPQRTAPINNMSNAEHKYASIIEYLGWPHEMRQKRAGCIVDTHHQSVSALQALLNRLLQRAPLRCVGLSVFRHLRVQFLATC